MDSSSLSLVLRASIGLRWLEPLASLGAHTIDDVTYLLKEDLEGIGMKTVDIRRLNAAIRCVAHWNYNAGMCRMQGWGVLPGPAMHSLPSPPPPGSCPPSWMERAVLEEAMTKVEQEAIKSLGIVEEGSEMVDYAVAARVHLNEPSRTTISAINAENAIGRALSLGPHAATRKALQKAELYIRDTIVLRTQVHVPLGSRHQFVEALQKAYGEVPDGALAKLLNSHAKVVCPLFAYAFVSNSRRENGSRRHGPRGKKARDVRKAGEALTAPPGLDVPHQMS